MELGPVTLELRPLSSPDTSTAIRRSMPDFAGGTHAHRHSIHSALVSLEALSVNPQRIVLRRVGRQAASPGSIVRQSPLPGTEITSSTRVELDVSGLGFTHSLPVGMWDSGGEATAGTREILEPLDDPLEKLRHWFHEGAPLFRIAADNPVACGRWLALFGVDPESWPRAMWYPLASLIAKMPQLSCSLEGCALALMTLAGLPIRSTKYHPVVSSLPEAATSRLGQRSSRLGVDLLLGDFVEDLAELEIEIGPVSLEVYERFAETVEDADLLRRIFEMVIPISSAFRVRWTVEDLRQAPRLGFAHHNARLGINTHMGTTLAMQGSEP